MKTKTLKPIHNVSLDCTWWITYKRNPRNCKIVTKWDNIVINWKSEEEHKVDNEHQANTVWLLSLVTLQSPTDYWWRWEVLVSTFWRYFTFSVLVGKYSRSLNSPLFPMILGLFKTTSYIVTSNQHHPYFFYPYFIYKVVISIFGIIRLARKEIRPG